MAEDVTDVPAIDLRSRWNEERRAWTVKSSERLDLDVDVVPMLFTTAIVTTPRGQDGSYLDRWCYGHPASALLAAMAWDPDTEPEPVGWHRHPPSGRRRPDGDPSREYVEW